MSFFISGFGAGAGAGVGSGSSTESKTVGDGNGGFGSGAGVRTETAIAAHGFRGETRAFCGDFLGETGVGADMGEHGAAAIRWGDIVKRFGERGAGAGEIGAEGVETNGFLQDVSSAAFFSFLALRRAST